MELEAVLRKFEKASYHNAQIDLKSHMPAKFEYLLIQDPQDCTFRFLIGDAPLQ